MSSPHESGDASGVVGTVGTTMGMDYCFADTEEKDDETPGVLVMHCGTHARFMGCTY